MNMLATQVPSPLTPDDLLNLRDQGKLCELVDGRLVEKNVSRLSSKVGVRIASLLSISIGDSGEAAVYGPDLGYQCFPKDRERVRKPDVSIIRSERLQALGSDDFGYSPISADLAVEVTSPNDLDWDVDRKINEYLDAGFKLVWIVHPQSKRVHVYRADGSGDIFGTNDEITGEIALPEFRCQVSRFF